MKYLKIAKESEKSFLLLKVDIVKAFDCINWKFLYRLLEKIGFGPNFLRMIKVVNAFASSSILLNGKVTEVFQLKRSLRQGCPLSPLLYLVVANALSMLLTQAANRGRRIKGVYIQETDDQVKNGQVANDTNVVVEVRKECVEATFVVFRTMGEASRLQIKYTGVKAVLISEHPVPHELDKMGFIF